MSRRTRSLPTLWHSEKAADFLTRLLLSHRRTVLWAAAVMTLILGAGILRLQLAVDVRLFFGEDNPERLALERMESVFGRTNNIIFVLAPRSGDVFTASALHALRQMTQDAKEIPGAMRIDSIANVPRVTFGGGFPSVLPLYTAKMLRNPARIARLRRDVLSRPELLNRLISEKGDVAGIVVIVDDEVSDLSAVPRMAARVRSLIKEWRRRFPDIDVKVTGGVMANAAYAEAGARDMRTLVPVMSVLIFAVIALGLRSFRATAIVMSMIAASVLSALGAAGWFGVLLTPATSSASVAVMVLVIASCVHIIMVWARAREAGVTPDAAVRESLVTNLSPVTVTNLTTAVGFVCMNQADSQPLRDMGNLVAVGVVVGWILSITALPVLLCYLRDATRASPLVPKMSLGWVAETAIRRRRLILVLFAAGIPLSGWGISRVVFDDDYVRYFDHSFAFRGDTEFAERRLTGLSVIQFALASGSPGGILEPRLLDEIDAFADWYAHQKKVVFVGTLTTLLKRLNQIANGNDPRAYRLASSRKANAAYLSRYAQFAPDGRSLSGIVDDDRSTAKFTAVIRDVSGREIRALADAGEAWLASNAPELASPATGLSVVFARLSHRNSRSMVSGTLMALALISAILVVTFRSIRFGAISLVPNFFPAIFAFGIWGFTVGEINLAGSVVTAMTLGIVVDDTIHLLTHYLRTRNRLGQAPEAALRQVIPSVGPALVVTSVALALGFAVILLSGFQMSEQIGLMSVIVIAVALVADLFFLPALLLVLDRPRSFHGRAP